MSRRIDSSLWIRFAASVLGDGGGGQPLMPPSSSRTSSLSGQYRVDLSKLDYLFFVYSSSYCLYRSASILAHLSIIFKFRVSFRVSELSAYGAHLFYYLSRTYRARPYVVNVVIVIIYRQSLVSPVHHFQCLPPTPHGISEVGKLSQEPSWFILSVPQSGSVKF